MQNYLLKKDLDIEKNKSDVSHFNITINDFKVKNLFVACKNID